MNTDYNLYKIFLYLFEEKSISKTANKLYVSQPAISYSLKELESQLGYTLFYRNSKGIEPTIEAKELYGYISTAFNILRDAEERLKNLNTLKTGCIRIGITSQLGYSCLSNYVNKFHKLFPEIKFEFITKSSLKMLEMLEMRKLDILIDVELPNSKKDVSKFVLSKLHGCFCYNAKILKEINIKKEADLQGHLLILPTDMLVTRQKLDDYMSKKSVKLNALFECDTPELMLGLIRNGIGVGYLFEEDISKESDKRDFSLISFDNKLPTTEIYCLYINEFLTTASKKFVEMLENSK